MQSRSSWTGVAAVAGAACLWGLWSLLVRPTHLPPSVTGPLVMAMMGLAALPVALRGGPARWDRTTAILLVANAGLDAVNLLAFFAAYAHTSVAVAVLTHYLAPVLVALAAPRIDGITTPGARGAAVVATVGLALVLEPWRAAPDGLWLGAGLGALSAFAYAGNVFVVRRLGERIGAARAISYHGLIAAVLIAPLGLGGYGAVDLRDLALLGGGAAVLGAGAGIAFVAGLERIGSARAAVLTFCEPLVAVLAGWIGFGEQPSPWAAVGGALVLGAGVAVARARERVPAVP